MSAPVSESFPWGDRNPEGGYRVGDEVGLIYSDHEHYVFDNPTGVVTAVEDDEGSQRVTVQLEAEVGSDVAFLIARKGGT